MWTNMYGFETMYQINEKGQVLSKATNKIISQRQDKKGYFIVTLTTPSGKKTTKGVHRLLMETFRPCENMAELTVNHINHIKTDNTLDNLEWLTSEENSADAHRAGLVPYIGGNNRRAVRCVETGAVYESCTKAAEAVGIKSSGKIGDAAKDCSKTSGGYHWEYVE